MCLVPSVRVLLPLLEFQVSLEALLRSLPDPYLYGAVDRLPFTRFYFCNDTLDFNCNLQFCVYYCFWIGIVVIALCSFKAMIRLVWLEEASDSLEISASESEPSNELDESSAIFELLNRLSVLFVWGLRPEITARAIWLAGISDLYPFNRCSDFSVTRAPACMYVNKLPPTCKHWSYSQYSGANTRSNTRYNEPNWDRGRFHGPRNPEAEYRAWNYYQRLL